MHYPKWLEQQVSLDRISNIYTRTHTEEPNVYVLEQEINNFIHFFVDDDYTIPIAMDRIISEVTNLYPLYLQYTEELSLIAKLDLCSSADLYRNIEDLKQNDIAIYTLESYIKEAFNLFAESEMDTTIVPNLYRVAISNPILDYLSKVQIKDYFQKLKVYKVYNYMTRTIILYAILRGKSVFPLQTEDFRKANAIQLFRELYSKRDDVPLTLQKYFELRTEADFIQMEVDVNGF